MSSKSSKPAQKKGASAGRKFKPVGKAVPIPQTDYDVVRLTTSQGRIGPTPERVAARALALTSVAFRAYLEQDVDEDRKWAKTEQKNLVQWLVDTGLCNELEPEEARFIDGLPGRFGEEYANEKSWRIEGAGVLAWALGRLKVPPYDQSFEQQATSDSLGFSNYDVTLLRSARLRPMSQINRLATHLTVVSWRIVHFSITRNSKYYRDYVQELGRCNTGVGERMDFAETLRSHARFRKDWLKGLRLVRGDLAFKGVPIAEADEKTAGCSRLRIDERQIAAFWLQGEAELYSEVEPATILSAC